MDDRPAGWYPDPGGEPGHIRWWDGSQWTDHVAQRNPQVSTVPAYRPSARLAWWAVALTLAVLGIAAALPLVVDSSFESIRAAAARGEEGPYTVYDALNVAYFGTLLVAGIVGAAWLHRVRRNAEALAPEARHARSAGWAWGGWVCPVVGLWFPFQVVRDVARATRAGGVGLVGFWWAAFLVMQVVAQVDSAHWSRVLDDPDIEWDALVSSVRTFDLVSLTSTTIAAVLWIAVVSMIERDQGTAARGVRETSGAGVVPGGGAA